MIKEAIILAGGKGTRLKSVLPDLPKPMAPINGKPFLVYQLKYLQNNGIDSIVLSVGYKWQVIRKYFGDQYKNIHLKYSIEKEPLGTGGAIKQALTMINGEEVIILNGDTYFPVNISHLFKYHTKKSSEITVALKFLQETNRFGNILMNSNNRIIKFFEKVNFGDVLINGGIYIVSKKIFKKIDKIKFSFEKDILSKTCRFLIFGKDFSTVFIDIGIPKDYYFLIKNQKKIIHNIN